MSFKEDVRRKLEEISTKQTEHTVQMGFVQKVMEEHHRRSMNLEARVVPIEQHVISINKIVKIIVTVIGSTAALLAILSRVWK